ncbi:type II toxin-antitoxin system RelE family toxin [Methanoregula sp.]|jgi:mRNA interferase RelE/StbE|uniref:type II toxin-antitoxin system RelE family toxin n=1 Tax=Methanoregula sp. TaxID=2052170 RepID=UPI003C73553F
MSYSIFWTDRSRKDLEKLSPSISKRIVDKIESLSEDPHRTAERCEGYPWYHQRVGNYRAILEIDDTELMVSILKVGPRKKVYDR